VLQRGGGTGRSPPAAPSPTSRRAGRRSASGKGRRKDSGWHTTERVGAGDRATSSAILEISGGRTARSTFRGLRPYMGGPGADHETLIKSAHGSTEDTTDPPDIRRFSAACPCGCGAFCCTSRPGARSSRRSVRLRALRGCWPRPWRRRRDFSTGGRITGVHDERLPDQDRRGVRPGAAGGSAVLLVRSTPSLRSCRWGARLVYFASRRLQRHVRCPRYYGGNRLSLIEG